MAKTQITTAAEAASLVKDGMTVMVGGFMANGTPEPIIDELVKSNVKDLTIICNDAGFGRKKDKETGEFIPKRMERKSKRCREACGKWTGKETDRFACWIES